MAQEASLRDAYGEALCELGRENPDIVVLDADLARSTMTCLFASQFPNRFFDCGIAEQNMIGIASGLASCGKIPFASTFAVFAASRCFDQLRLAVAQPRMNVKLVATHGGISVGEDGFSHHSIEDLALIGSLPNFKIIVPSDAVETKQAIREAASKPGPFYIRLTRPKLAVLHGADFHFKLGTAETMREGTDVTIIAIGVMVKIALDAADELKQDNISCRVLNMSTLKPIDEKAIVDAATQTGAIVTAEEHLQHGGLGSEVAQVVAKSHPVPMEFIALKDTFAKSGKPEELFRQYGLTSGDIKLAVQSVLKRKAGSTR